MHNPLLWLGLSLFLVAVCLVAVLLVAIPVIQELSRTARSAEKLLDMLSRELPPTLRSLRSTGEDLSELSGQVNEGVRSASQVVTQVDQGLETVRSQAESVKRGSISLLTGLRAAWQQWKDPDADLYDDDPGRYDDFDPHGESGWEMPGEDESFPNGYSPSSSADQHSKTSMSPDSASPKKDKLPSEISGPESSRTNPKALELGAPPVPEPLSQAVDEQG